MDEKLVTRITIGSGKEIVWWLCGIEMADAFNIIVIVCFALAIAALLVTIILFFKLNIKKIISDLSGHTAKKYIEQQKEKKIEKDITITHTHEKINYDQWSIS